MWFEVDVVMRQLTKVFIGSDSIALTFSVDIFCNKEFMYNIIFGVLPH